MKPLILIIYLLPFIYIYKETFLSPKCDIMNMEPGVNQQQPPTNNEVHNSSILPSLNIMPQPQTFQFSIIGEIEKHIYDRLLGYRIVINETRNATTGQVTRDVKKEKVYEPIISEWGANRIITLLYNFLNEQTPFAHLDAPTVIKMVNVFSQQFNADIYKNFEKYFTFPIEKYDREGEKILDKDGKPEMILQNNGTLTSWRLLLNTVSFTIVIILSRTIQGRESMLFYNQARIGLTGNIPTMGQPMQR